MADERMTRELEARVKYHQSGVTEIDGNGICIECGQIVKPVVVNGKQFIGRWCCIECRDAWEAEY